MGRESVEQSTAVRSTRRNEGMRVTLRAHFSQHIAQFGILLPYYILLQTSTQKILEFSTRIGTIAHQQAGVVHDSKTIKSVVSLLW